jgi:hypothetical protein
MYFKLSKSSYIYIDKKKTMLRSLFKLVHYSGVIAAGESSGDDIAHVPDG